MGHLRRNSSHEGLEDLPFALGRVLLRQSLKARGQAVQAVVSQQRHPKPAYSHRIELYILMHRVFVIKVALVRHN